jgi:hypothetical protein
MSTTEVAPTSEVKYGNIGIRYWEADKERKIKRHYQVRDFSIHGPHADWHTVPSVTTVQDQVLKKEALISWAQRVGAGGALALANMKVLRPVRTQGGAEVLGFYDASRGGLIVADEWEVIELLKQHGLTTNDAKDAGAERGTSVHDAFENWQRTGVLPDPSVYPISEQGYVVALQTFLRESEAEPRTSEVMVCSVDDGWAGRYDGDICLPYDRTLWTHRTEKGRGDQQTVFTDGLYTVDVKTGKGPYIEHGEQLEAYEEGRLLCGMEPSLQRCVIHCHENGQYRFVPVGSGSPRIKQYPYATYADFLATLRKWQAMETRKARRADGT